MIGGSDTSEGRVGAVLLAALLCGYPLPLAAFTAGSLAGPGDRIVAIAALAVLFGIVVWTQYRLSRLRGERADGLRRLAVVLESSTSGIVGLSSDGCLLLSNGRAQDLLGMVAADEPSQWMEAVEFLDVETCKPLAPLQNPVARALSGHLLQGETVLLVQRGCLDPVLVRITSAHMLAQDPDDLSVVLSFEDVTLQEQDRDRSERFGRLNALGELTRGIAHDFNNVLTAVKYSIQLSEAATDATDRARHTAQALNSVMRGADLTQRLLAFARQEPGLAKSHRIQDVLGALQAAVADKVDEDVTLEVNVDDPDLLVFADVAQLQAALLNLILNACDAFKRARYGNHIVIRVRAVPDAEIRDRLRSEIMETYVAPAVFAEHRSDKSRQDGKAFRYLDVSVSDNGPGMDGDERANAITPLFTTKARQPGAGLGLSAVYGFVQQSNGILQITSEPGQGTTVCLCLPRGGGHGLREAPVERYSDRMGEGQSVLIVEDESDVRSPLADLVTSFGFEVLTAGSGGEALEIVGSDAVIDVMLADVVIPGGRGGVALGEAARRVRPSLPIVYMTGYASGPGGDVAEHVVSPLIRKPCPPAVLADAIVQALSQPVSSTRKRAPVRVGL